MNIYEVIEDAQAKEGKALAEDVILALRAHCRGVIERLPQSHATMMALPKLDEMVFWMQAALRRSDLPP